MHRRRTSSGAGVRAISGGGAGASRAVPGRGSAFPSCACVDAPRRLRLSSRYVTPLPGYRLIPPTPPAPRRLRQSSRYVTPLPGSRLPPPTALALRSLVPADGRLELQIVREPVPAPGPDEVVLRVEAAPINPSDLGLLFGAADFDTITT